MVNRVQKVLEDANVKLGSVASDVVGASGRAMLEAIIAGEQDAGKLAQLAKGTLRNKIPKLCLALEGRITDHHRFMLRQYLEMLDFVDKKMAAFDSQIEEKGRPFAPMVTQWMEVPGIRQVNAYSLVAEIGPDMNQFPSAGHLASWACVCPGNRESAGKQTSGQTRKGNRWLRRSLCEAAWAASHAKKSYFQAQYSRLARVRGKNRALMAVAHSLLVTVYSFTRAGTSYQDLGRDYFDRIHKSKLERSLVHRLEKLGHTVHLEPKTSAA